jgi:hypothetical protein
MDGAPRRRHPQDILVPWVDVMGKDDGVFDE